VPLLLVLGLAACRHNEYAPPPPPEVFVAHPEEREVTTFNEFAGHTVSVEAIEIRARVQGILESMHFTPGTDVQKGDLLFIIEPELYQARVDRAVADLQNAQTELAAAEQQLQITQAIFKKDAGSRTELVQKTQARDQASAAVAQAKAALEMAQIDFEYTKIHAPISGLIGRNLVDIGNLVGAGQPTVLTSIVRYDPIYAYFDMSERDLLTYQDLQRRGQTATQEGEPAPAYLAMATEDGFPHVGRVDYRSNRLDPSTGTFEMRAVFPNEDRVIVPGTFARIRLPFTRERAILVPDDAVGTEQGGHFILVVNDENTVEHRRVTVGSRVDDDRIITSGASTGDWVVVRGLQRARPGIKVKRVIAPTPGAAQGAQ